ncbi:hypothetical protein CPB97_001933 [Podila verticillata]|nr:hypothetical protein CPB97_001933 [Podila verticillata]
MLTCRAWYHIYAPVSYKKLFLWRHRSTRVCPLIDKYGIHVQHLQLDEIDVHGALHAVRNTPSLRQLDLLASHLSSSDMDEVLSSAVSDELFHLKVELQSHSQRSGFGPPLPWFPESMLRHVSHLRNLRSLQWAAKGMTIHVDDILRVLQACPRLVSLNLGELNVVYVGHDSPFPRSAHDMYFLDPPGPLVSIPDEDVETLYSGHRLQELTLNGTKIADEGLLRLLGIDIEPIHHTTSRNPNLISLDVNTASPTHNSSIRIVQECRRLEVLKLRSSRMATLELFRGDIIWPSAPLIKELCLEIRKFGTDPSFYVSAMLSYVPVFSAAEKLQIWDRLRSMVNLRKLDISGAPIDYPLAEDLSFAKQLESASVHLTLRMAIAQIKTEKEGILAQAKDWASRHSPGWRYCIKTSPEGELPKLELTYRKE